jgi:hypothetical protein
VEPRLAKEVSRPVGDTIVRHYTSLRARLRSIAVVSVSAYGSAIGTQWFCANGDIATLIGKLTVLIHDVMAARQ